MGQPLEDFWPVEERHEYFTRLAAMSKFSQFVASINQLFLLNKDYLELLDENQTRLLR